MKQKLGIAAALMENPDILILDEPANALDEKSEEQLWNIVRERKRKGSAGDCFMPYSRSVRVCGR